MSRPRPNCVWCGKMMAGYNDYHNYEECLEHQRVIIKQLLEKSRSLLNQLPESEIDIMRECIGNTNAGAILFAIGEMGVAIAAAEGEA